jgi:hypothetical protein
MVAKQVIFRDTFDAEDDNCSPLLGGIAIYEDYFQGTDAPFLELKGVICGECGGWIEAEDCEILEVLDTWWTLDEAIKDNVKPDGTRGFRPDNQIKMEFD